MILELQGPIAPLFQLLWRVWGPFRPPVFLSFVLPCCLFCLVFVLFMAFYIFYIVFVFFVFLYFCILVFFTFCLFVFLHFCIFALLPFDLFVTTIIIMGSISTTRPIFIPIWQFFIFTTHFTIKFTTNHYHYCHPPPPQCFLYLRETQETFWEACKDFEGEAKIWWQSQRRRRRSKSTDNLVLGFWCIDVLSMMGFTIIIHQTV